MAEKVVLITGATDGLGKALAHKFAAAGAIVIVHGRSAQRCRDTATEMAAIFGNRRIETCVADFSRLQDVFAMVENISRRFPRLDILINNAGVGVESERRVSHDGYEWVLQVNYLSTFVLTLGLAARVRAAAGRIICVSSLSQATVDFDDPQFERSWEATQAYGRSKWAQIAFANTFAKVARKNRMSIHSLHPGSFMPTKLVVGKYPVADSLETGVHSVWNIAHHPDPAAINGIYFDRTAPARALETAYDTRVQFRLIQLSKSMLDNVRRTTARSAMPQEWILGGSVNLP